MKNETFLCSSCKIDHGRYVKRAILQNFGPRPRVRPVHFFAEDTLLFFAEQVEIEFEKNGKSVSETKRHSPLEPKTVSGLLTIQ